MCAECQAQVGTQALPGTKRDPGWCQGPHQPANFLRNPLSGNNPFLVQPGKLVLLLLPSSSCKPSSPPRARRLPSPREHCVSPGASREHWLSLGPPTGSHSGLPWWPGNWGLLTPPQGPLIVWDTVALPESSFAHSWGVPRMERGGAGIKTASLRHTWVRGAAGR